MAISPAQITIVVKVAVRDRARAAPRLSLMKSMGTIANTSRFSIAPIKIWEEFRVVFKTMRVAAMSAALILAPVALANAQSSGGSSAGNLADPANPMNPDAPAVKSGSSGGDSAAKSDSGGKKKMGKKSGKKSKKKSM